jgi:hypothetical protein
VIGGISCQGHHTGLPHYVMFVISNPHWAAAASLGRAHWV